MIKKMLQAICFCIAVIASGAAAAAPIGYVHDVKGSVSLRDTGKPAAQAKAGDTFEQGATFITAADGQITLKFEDGEIAILSPNTQFIATTYVYNKNKVADGNIVFNLLRGGLRFVSGVMTETNPSKFAVRTPTATAGVRGSAGTIVVSQDGQSVTAVTSKGVLTLTVGTQTVTLPVGQVSSSVAGAALTNPVALNALAAGQVPGQALLAGVALLVQTLGAVNAPPNNPVAVQATANAISLAVQAANDPTNTALQAAANAALQEAITQNAAAIASAITGGAAAGAGADAGGQTVDVLAPSNPPPSNPPPTFTSTGVCATNCPP